MGATPIVQEHFILALFDICAKLMATQNSAEWRHYYHNYGNQNGGRSDSSMFVENLLGLFVAISQNDIVQNFSHG